MSIQKIILVTLICTLIVIGVSIHPALPAFKGFFAQQKIFDNDALISNDSDSYSYRDRRGSVGNNACDLTAKFSGVETLWTLTATVETEIEINHGVDIDKGDFKAVIVTPDRKVLNIIEGSGTATKTITLPVGVNKFKIVGRRASGNIKFAIEKADDVEIVEGKL